MKAKEKINWIVKGVARRFLCIKVDKYHYLKTKIDICSVKKYLGQKDIQVNELTYNDFLTGDINMFGSKKMESINKRLNDGMHYSYGIIDEGHLLCSAWLSLHTISLPVESYSKELKEDEGYLEDDYCTPSARGRGYQTYLINHRLNHLYNIGRKTAIIIIQDKNTTSLHNAIKSGFNDMGTFHCGKIFGIPFVTLKKELYDY